MTKEENMNNALTIARSSRAEGGRTKDHSGPIHSPVAGRTDHLPMHVRSGSYVIPADIISAMGEGNTMSGFKIARRMFSSKPYFQEGEHPYESSGAPYHGNNGPYNSNSGPYGAKLGKAEGGQVDNESLVPIVAAGGEYVISPEEINKIGQGDMDHGHKILDEFVKNFRQKTIKTLKNLPGPKKD